MVAYLTILTLVAVIAFGIFKGESKNKVYTLSGCGLTYIGGILVPAGILLHAKGIVIVFGAIAVVVGIPLLIVGIKADRIENEKDERNRLIALFDKCYNAGITDISTYENRKKAIRFLDANCGCNFAAVEDRPHIFSNFFNKAKEIYMEEFDRIQREKMYALRNAEENKRRELEKYACLYGVEKKRKMMLDKARENREAAETMKRAVGMTVSGSQQKEKDSAILGGLASGLAGGAAGLATALNVEVQNAQIREQNAVNLQRLSPYVTFTYDQIVGLVNEAERLESWAEGADSLKIADDGPEIVFKYLEVSTLNVSISQTGAFTVDVFVSAKNPIITEAGNRGRIDGTIAAVMIQNGVEVGRALMVLPMEGISSRQRLNLTGISCGDAKTDVSYEMHFEPYKLWIIEN